MKKGPILLVFLLGGCDAVIPSTMANYRMQQSESAYKACLARAKASQDAGAAPVNCDVEKANYEMDFRAFQTEAAKPAQPIPYYSGVYGP